MTIVVRIGGPPEGSDAFALVELLVEDGRPGWDTTPVATASLPRELPAVPGLDGAPLVAIRTALVDRDGAGTDLFASAGAYLHDLLFGGDLQDAWEMALRGNGAPQRVVLDVRRRDLALVPWELLACDGTVLFLGQVATLVRGRHPFDRERTAERAELGPLKVLLVVGAPDDAGLQADEEVCAVHRALASADTHGRVHLEVLYAPSLDGLHRELETLRPHVLHVIAHGDVDANGKTSYVQFRGDESWDLRTAQIQNLLPCPPIVLLNSCHTSAPGVQEKLSGLAQAFHGGGTAAVVAMQGAIESDYAVCFAGAFYGSLAKGEAIDLAVARGRQSIAREADLDRRDWALPVLTVTAPPDEILRVRQPPPLAPIEQFEAVRAFVDRGLERRTLWWGVDPDDVSPRDLLVVTGDEEVGKTSLVHSCLLTCHRRGRKVVYVSLAGAGDWLAVVRAVAHGSETSPIGQPLGEPVLSQFNDDLNRLLQGLDRRQIAPGDVVEDQGRKAIVESERALQHIAAVFAALLEALRRSARDEPFILALDDIGEVPSLDLEDHVWLQFLRPIAFGQVAPVRAIIIADQHHWSKLPSELRTISDPVRVSPFPPSELVRLSREYCARRQIDYNETWRDFATALARTAVPHKPGFLRVFEGFAARAGS